MARFSLPPPPRLQDLPPPQAKFCLDAAHFLENELCLSLSGSHVLAGFSGGADSTALLLCLRYLSPKLGFSLSAAHLDHQLRPSSGNEAAQCGAFCAALGIPFFCRRCDVAELGAQDKLGIEEAARKARYAFYDQTAAHENCNWIATGHTANDWAEDILMRLIRGTGWPGLAGMEAVDAQRRLFRPLLLIPRVRIEDFLSALGVGWIEDESNADMAYFRNRVRGRILPLLLRENPAFLEKTAGLWKLGRLDAQWIASLLPQPLPTASASVGADGKRQAETEATTLFLPRKQLERMPKALRLRCYKQTLAALGPGQARLDALLALEAAFAANTESTEHQFSGGKLALVSRQGIHFSTPHKAIPFV
jgi:tRNA(Ile)-lysidine synthase